MVDRSLAAIASALALAMLLTGCSKQLLGSLDENAANQVVSTLRLEGINADKSVSGEKAWKVTVADDQFAEAVQIIERHNLPAPQFQGLGQVFKKESLVSTPTEERARLIYALSQELERSLLEIDGVLVARVHPVILPYDPLNPKRVAATASVLIKYRPGSDVASREGMVRGLVAAGIEGLSYDDVRVLMVPGTEVLAPVVDKSVASQATLPGIAQQWNLQSPTTLFAGIVASLLALLAIAPLWIRSKGRPTPADAKTGLTGRWSDAERKPGTEGSSTPRAREAS